MRLMRTILLTALLALAVSFAVPAQKRRSSRIAKPAVAKSNVEPISTEGLKALVSQQRDKPLLVNFWATWCDPCRDEFPDLVKIDNEYRPKSLDFVTVSLDEVKDIKTQVPQFLAQMKASMPAYLLDAKDPEPAINAIDTKWQGDLPATFLFSDKGVLIYKHFGRVNTAELREQIQKLVKE